MHFRVAHSGSKWLDRYSYRIKVSWEVLALAAIVPVLIALIRVSFRAIKAAAANRVKSVRNE